jgi:hypothetical protein
MHMQNLHRLLIVPAVAGLAVVCATAGASTAATQKSSSSTFGVFVNVTTAATVALSGTTFTWKAIKPTVKSYVAADNSPMQVKGLIRTSPGGGAGSIVIMSPATVAATKDNNAITVNEFALTCSGAGNVGTPPTYAAALTKLKASTTVPCATWGPGATSKLNFNFALYLQTQNAPQDVYQSNGFSIIATAT